MASPLLPRTLSPRLAAILSGRSIAGFRRDVMPYTGDAGGRVDTASLEDFLARSITAEDYLRADRRLDNRREQQRQRKNTSSLGSNAGGSAGERQSEYQD